MQAEVAMSRVDIVSGPDAKYEGYFKLTETRLRFVKNDGSMSRTVSRLNLDRPDASAVLLYDPGQDAVVLVKQFRYSVFAGGDGGWMTEVVAGTLAPGDDPEQAARREVMEETGYRIDAMEHIHTFYPSPGGCSEKCFLYAAEVDDSMRVGEGGGAPDEEEDIEVLKVPAREALAMLDRKEINDGKTLVALQWLKAGRR
jgi:nudix-type nucleoside diphosphatase (YffH/AdpP family)